jgi:hypothetical protein
MHSRVASTPLKWGVFHSLAGSITQAASKLPTIFTVLAQAFSGFPAISYLATLFAAQTSHPNHLQQK